MVPFKKPTQCLKGYYNEMQIRSERLLSPDKAYGRIAWNNCAKLCNFDPIDNSPTVIVSESAALWRGSRLDKGNGGGEDAMMGAMMGHCIG